MRQAGRFGLAFLALSDPDIGVALFGGLGLLIFCLTVYGAIAAKHTLRQRGQTPRKAKAKQAVALWDREARKRHRR